MDLWRANFASGQSPNRREDEYCVQTLQSKVPYRATEIKRGTLFQILSFTLPYNGKEHAYMVTETQVILIG